MTASSQLASWSRLETEAGPDYKVNADIPLHYDVTFGKSN